MANSSLKFELADGVATITFNQPARGNPLDQAFCDELNRLATECSLNPGVRAVLIQAEGRFFSVGGDLKTLTQSQDGLNRFVLEGTTQLHMAISRFARMKAPVVVAVHALVAGGAVALIAGADFVLAAPEASFYAAFAGIGLSCDTGASYYLPRRVGSRRAAEYFLLNETWTAEKAAQAGLINRVVEGGKLREEALALARRLANGPTKAFGEIKNLLLSSSQGIAGGAVGA